MSLAGHRRSLSHFAVVAVAGLAPFSVARAQVTQQAAPAVFDTKSAAHLRTEYINDLDTVHVKIVALANAIPADKYSWRPGAGVRSVSEVLMHVASEWYYYGPLSLGGKPPADFGVPKEKLPAMEKVTGKPAVLAELNKSWTYCAEQLRAADPGQLTGKYKPWGTTLDQAVLGMAGDQHEHLGQLIAYSRMLGVKPPWTK